MSQMQEPLEPRVRRTTTDDVYEKLHEEIVSLKVLPGTKLSESEVGRRFGVSRQPVRKAFTRLGNEELLLIRPQKATQVRGFSMERIAHARFVRLSVELEVVRCACESWSRENQAILEENLNRQKQAKEAGDMPRFHALDYEFHRLICELSGKPLAFEAVQGCKQKVDRLCMLGLARDQEAAAVLADHRDLADCIGSGDLDKARHTIRRHLTRLDATIELIHETHPDYFE